MNTTAHAPGSRPLGPLFRLTSYPLFLLAALAAGAPRAAHSQSLTQDIAPTHLSADLSDGRAVFVNPAMMAADPMQRWDLVAGMERDVLRRGLVSVSGPKMHLGYRYDSGPSPPMSELRLGTALGSASGGVGYALRIQRESVWGPGAGAGVDVGFFFRPNPGATVSWVLRNAGNQPRMEHRHQLIGVALHPEGARYTLSGEVRWDDGGFRTNLYRWGIRAQVSPAIEISSTYQPPRLASSPEIQLGFTLSPGGINAHAAHRVKQDARGSGSWVGLSGIARAPGRGK